MNSVLYLCVMNIHCLENNVSKVHNLEFTVMPNEDKLVYLTTHYWKELSIFIEKHGKVLIIAVCHIIMHVNKK